MREIAKKYIEVGLRCLPVKKDKSPDVKITWKGGIDNLDLYTYGIGIICGKDSGGLEILDFDNHFGDAKETLTNFMLTDEVKEIFQKNEIVIESTMNDGYHVLYRCDYIVGNKKLASKPVFDEKNNQWKPDTIIETRGEGGYFVSAPSPKYKVIKNDILNIPKITKKERNILISTCMSFNEWNDVVKTNYEGEERPGDIYNKDLASGEEAKQALLNTGWTEVRKHYLRRPNKKEGISATFGKIGEGMFYCFTSSAYPFLLNKSYTPFQVISLLEYKGDFGAFAKELVKRYDIKQDFIKKNDKLKLDFKDILKKSHVDLSIKINKPPTILSIYDKSGTQTMEKRLFTLGNFSCITGKAKSKKTFLSILFNSALIKNDFLYNKIMGTMIEGKRNVLLFDTEQGEYDVYNTGRRVEAITGKQEHFGIFSLREYTPIERCDIIEYALKKLGKNTGYVMIDGIADLAKAVNDEEEATRVVSLLLRWSKQYNLHISTIIHQNKDNNYATGHLGSAILKKAEVIISVTKDKMDFNRSIVECDRSRAMDFDSFSFVINNKGLPMVDDGEIEKEKEF